jgi:hypothetical protein
VVFNATQIDGMPAREECPQQEWDANERAETILANSGASITHDQMDRAFYRPVSDSIHLPPKNQFDTPEKYYATALHELGHWTGHPDRLDRDLAHPFGSEGYAKEELRAEIASMMVGLETGVGHDPSQHAAYVGGWVKALKDDPKEIMRAAADAEKIRDFVMDFEQKKEQTQTQEPIEETYHITLIEEHRDPENIERKIKTIILVDETMNLSDIKQTIKDHGINTPSTKSPTYGGWFSSSPLPVDDEGIVKTFSILPKNVNDKWLDATQQQKFSDMIGITFSQPLPHLPEVQTRTHDRNSSEIMIGTAEQNQQFAEFIHNAVPVQDRDVLLTAAKQTVAERDARDYPAEPERKQALSFGENRQQKPMTPKKAMRR